MTTATTTATTTSIGPDAIASASTTGGPAFVLSASEWLEIQAYVMTALQLPTTMDAFRNSLGSGAASDLTQFQPLIDCYSAVSTQCTNWQANTFPNSVKLANNVAYYGTSIVPAYYGAIQTEAEKLETNPNDTAAQQALVTVLTRIAGIAQGYADNAAAVSKQIQDFANQTTDAHTTLYGVDGTGGLMAKYNSELGPNSDTVKTLQSQIDTQNGILQQANADYNHDVIVAATSATYAWIFPFGTIAAGVVAGVYGKKATDALNLVNDTKNQIAKLEAEEQADANLILTLNMAEKSLTGIQGSLTAAVPLLEKLEGVWGAIANNLTQIVTSINSDITTALPLITALDITTDISAWQTVAAEANSYQLNAYVTSSSITTPSNN